MSSAIPAAFSAAMSTTTTSASSLTAIARATVAPTFPAPPTTVTLRFIGSCLPVRPQALGPRHVLNHCGREFRSLELGGSRDQARQIVGDPLGPDRALERRDHEVGRLGPAHV